MSKSAIFDGKPVNIPKFKDNQPGTIPLIEWKQQLEQHAQEDTNNVGVRILWGTTTAIPSGATQEALKEYSALRRRPNGGTRNERMSTRQTRSTPWWQNWRRTTPLSTCRCRTGTCCHLRRGWAYGKADL